MDKTSPSPTPTATTFAPRSPQCPLIELDESGVADLFASLGFPFYQEQLNQHAITGEILVHLDHEALKDVGIHSVGQRLAILRSVYTLKVQQNIPIEAGHYVPPSEDMESAMMDGQLGVAASTQQVVDLLGERDQRIRNLEMEVQRLYDTLQTIRDDTLLRSSTKAPRPTVRSPTSGLFPHPLSNQSTLSRANSTSVRPSTTAGVLSHSALPDSPRSPMDSPRLLVSDGSLYPSGASSVGDLSPQRHLSPHEYQSVSLPATAVTPTTSSTHVTNDHHGGPGDSHPFNHHLNSSTNSNYSHPQDLSSSTTSSLAVPSRQASDRDRDRDRDRTGWDRSADSSSKPVSSPSAMTTTSVASGTASSSADNPYRSFRVTLEDPCYKVLPAALKKYKINDDWKQYALFICYGNTERCLAYDEKPLILFQKLKESNNNPVFMLRHIKDIKSPIAFATAKHAAKKEKRAPGIGNGVDKVPTMNRDGVSARPTRLHHPPVLLPVGKEAGKQGLGGEDDMKPPVSPREVPGYCIAIYPYLAERKDEFDVSVGDTFIIISKTKGWWVVYRDLGPSTSSLDSPVPRKSAWVPAGCLLETTVPPLSLADPSILASSASSLPSTAANVPIEPQYVVSVSTPNIALTDFAKTRSDELDIKKGQQLRILKRYNHWSYAIREDGHRGWIPSWFCGRIPRTGEGTPTTPTTAEGLKSSTGASSANLSHSTGSTSNPSTTTSTSNGLPKLGSTLPPIKTGGGLMDNVPLLGGRTERSEEV
ncbi:BZ3500_MvSof-1268-A1-R1_Chr6-2g08507 [Microbotryum saponariae]|uniref:BZ3500_MvSof-1268-A1-R1_Chr6-2g08507 protein n=1 Tax=Microbotryum saponariae TaxID=289078 RepID=A0A2X0LKY4_9BASI|nr:BZ3500_MvSof-1268-A1-R1_Chr6-2g08507 [Microbotryum saponariae]SDA07784.1 BZ3501_MvSof-1269-A2-R1_Chr6-1g08221 [Microbotryum saponariae]